MSEVILYPTETVYGLGINPFDRDAWEKLCELKNRDVRQAMSWLVRDVADIERYAIVTPTARDLIENCLPGPLTLILEARSSLPEEVVTDDGTVSFRMSSDPIAQKLIADHFQKHDAPLTCTSANLHGQPTLATPDEIKQQFGKKAELITTVIDDGPRTGDPSTVVRVIGEAVLVLRQGKIKV